MDVVKVSNGWKIDFLEPMRPFSVDEIALFDKYGSDSDSFSEAFVADANMEAFVSFLDKNKHIERLLVLHLDMNTVNSVWSESVLDLVE